MLSRWYDTLEDIIQTVKNDLQKLPLDTLNYKPAPKKWSVLECMQHLLLINDIYNPYVKKRFSEALPAKTNQPYQATWVGRAYMYIVSPNTKQKFPTAYFLDPSKKENPQKSNFNYEIINKYIAYLQEVQSFIKKSEEINLNKVKIRTSITSLVSFNLGDYYEVECRHNLRHLAQMKRVLATFEENKTK